MADVRFEVVRVSLPISGTVDATIAGFGTPKAAIFIASNANTNDSLSGQARFSLGFTDGTRQWCVASFDSNGLGTSQATRSQKNNRIAMLLSGSLGASLIAYDFDSWVTDGVRIGIAEGSSSSQRLCTVILIGGADVDQVYVGAHDDLGTGTSEVSVTAPGFEPDVLFLSTVGAGATSAETTTALLSFGCAINGPSIKEASVGLRAGNAVATSQNSSYVGNDSAILQAGASSVAWKGSVSSFLSTGFGITPSASANSDVFGYLAIKFTNNPDVDLVDVPLPASGDIDVSVGFEPNFAFMASMIQPSATARNALATSGNYGLGVSAFDANNAFSTAVNSVDAVGTTNTGSFASDSFRVVEPDGTGGFTGTPSFDSDGFDIALTTHEGSAKLAWALVIGAAESAAPTLTNALATSIGSTSIVPQVDVTF